jgi:single-strand DNA-binding protein
MSASTTARTGTALAHRNEIVLVGRLAAEPEPRTLPSGDEIVTFRLVVDRPPATRRDTGGRREPTVDTLDCAVSGAVLRRRLLGWHAGDVIEIEGTLRRRFWRAGAGVLSRCEVQARQARRRARAA